MQSFADFLALYALAVDGVWRGRHTEPWNRPPLRLGKSREGRKRKFKVNSLLFFSPRDLGTRLIGPREVVCQSKCVNGEDCRVCVIRSRFRPLFSTSIYSLVRRTPSDSTCSRKAKRVSHASPCGFLSQRNGVRNCSAGTLGAKSEKRVNEDMKPFLSLPISRPF